MTKEEAIALLMEQTWTPSSYGFHIFKFKTNTHLYLHLKEAFDALKMGYDGDFGGISGKDRDNTINLNVGSNQWKRAGIDINQLKLASTESVADEIAAITKKKKA
jgi:hypothetical protein